MAFRINSNMSKTITKRHFLIYKTTNKINGKIYIGKHITKNIDDGYMGSGKHLKRAINKYGIENFEREILFCFDNELEMNSKEAELVTEEFCLREDTYNLCVGGRGGFSYINREGLNTNNFSTRDKEAVIASATKGGETRRRKMKNDEEWRTCNINKIRLGINNYYKNNCGNFSGQRHTNETRKKMRLSSNKRQRCIIDDITYESVGQAAEILGIHRRTILYRLKSINFNNYLYV